MKKIKVSNQAELDKALENGFRPILFGNERFLVRGSAHVEAWGSAHVEARESAHVEARGSAHVEAWESAHVEACGSAHVEAWGSAHVEAGSKVSIQNHGQKTRIKGGVIIEICNPKSAIEWMEQYLVKPRSGTVVVLYKAVDEEYKSPHGFKYLPGTMPTAADWDGGKQECGGGLHFSPTPSMAKDYNVSATKYVACVVDLSEAVFNENASYPDKVKVSKVIEPIWEVDIEGNPICDIE